MALSFCSCNHHQELTDDYQLLGFNDNFMSVFSDSFINPLFEFDDQLFYSDSYTNLLPYFSSSPSDNIMSLSPDIFPLQDFDSYQYPKRQKSYADISRSSSAPSFFDGFVANSDLLLPEFPAPALPKFQVPAAAFNEGRSDYSAVAKKPNGESLSAQSIAARERRRKITEKTQELGKLIPGGSKMNTAEMLQAASQYVKFLQAQVKLLQLMESRRQVNI